MRWNKQLYEHEVTPPENAWNNIVHDLDNDHIIFKDKLKHAVTPPPAHLWDNIVRDLENDHLSFRDRLKHAAIAPPENVWDNIVHDIENDHLIFKEQLRHAAVLPPGSAWQNITEQLNAPGEQKTRVIRMPAIVRIAAAVAIIGILFFTANYYISNKAVERETAIVQPNDSPTSQSTVPSAGEKTTVSPGEQKYIASATITSKKHKAGRLSSDVPESYSGESYRLPLPASVTPVPESVTDRYDVHEGFGKYVRNLKGEIQEDVTLMDLPNSYFYTTGPDGQSIRVSSKFRNTIQYLNGSNTEELLDVILRESRYWKNRFKTWKEEVNNASFVPAPYNFMDIPELMRLLEQNSGK
jgi:hypothetical protein